MPFIDEDKLAELYKEVDNERKSADFFRQLHENNKKHLANKRFYVGGFYALLLVLFAGAFYFLLGADNETAKSTDISTTLEEYSLQMNALKKENELLKSKGTDLQSVLVSETVYSVQLMATSEKRLLLFSEDFVNFRGHPINDFYAYSLGNFATEEEAERFRQELIKMGLPDVWVTIYKEKERILIDRE